MQSGDDAVMTIGEIADRFGLATHVLRHWESVGLLTRDELVARIDALRDSLRFIEDGLECEHDDFTACPHYRAVVRARIGRQAPHVVV